MGPISRKYNKERLRHSYPLIGSMFLEKVVLIVTTKNELGFKKNT